MKAARKPRNSKVHATDEEPPPAGLAPPMGSPGTGQPKGAAGGAKATLGRKKKDDEPKGPGVLNAKTYEQRESTVTKLVEDVDVAKHEDHSGALAAFLDLLGIRKDAPVVQANGWIVAQGQRWPFRQGMHARVLLPPAGAKLPGGQGSGASLPSGQ